MYSKKLLQLQALLGHPNCNNSLFRQFCSACCILFRATAFCNREVILQTDSVHHWLCLHLRHYQVVQNYLLQQNDWRRNIQSKDDCLTLHQTWNVDWHLCSYTNLSSLIIWFYQRKNITDIKSLCFLEAVACPQNKSCYSTDQLYKRFQSIFEDSLHLTITWPLYARDSLHTLEIVHVRQSLDTTKRIWWIKH